MPVTIFNITDAAEIETHIVDSVELKQLSHKTKTKGWDHLFEDAANWKHVENLLNKRLQSNNMCYAFIDSNMLIFASPDIIHSALYHKLDQHN